jgi:hypothetical protein
MIERSVRDKAAIDRVTVLHLSEERVENLIVVCDVVEALGLSLTSGAAMSTRTLSGTYETEERLAIDIVERPESAAQHMRLINMARCIFRYSRTWAYQRE